MSKFDSMFCRLNQTKGVPGDPRGSQCTSNSPSPTDVTKTGNGERGAGNGERKSGNELSAETSIKIQYGR